MGSDTYAIVVGDVSGHGISSALLMAGVRAYLRGRVTQAGSVADIITDVNRLVSADTIETNQFMTLFFLVMEAQTGPSPYLVPRLLLEKTAAARAGHRPPPPASRRGPGTSGATCRTTSGFRARRERSRANPEARCRARARYARFPPRRRR